ncbi:MAG: RNA polymerase-binding protein DksA [Proteobacteria bacterium]|jgi:DnaK suppressor protein|nr:RNA polymerase-binding protein DksA [Pseudomonadota bacterium]MDB4827255.1 RNA polymerase-binding protein DksA [Gammaproteobacteria bacterium]MBT4108023.1 RNA polymerase-binding protein DksA [Pseudomonadota bacterium]MBT4357831.1 RNA polymerase-binding protein DksA [Pseudomonadota bacterium]MBT4988637.1 RNA polymerase-binding protein DksA [Pseudomonadota bacterium]
MPAAKKKVVEELIHGVKPHKPRRGEPYMGDVQSAHFREILNAWKKELLDDINKIMSVMQDENINLPDPNDRATLETDRSLELRTRDRERKLVKKINDSLVDLDKRDYGYCEDCGVDIGIKRLEARPTASLCIDCKSLSEIREKQNA